MKNPINKFLVLIYLVVLACSSQLVAQTSQNAGSTLRGQVVDELEAIIPGAKVTLVLPGGKTRVVTANGSGEFVIPNVPPGVYNFYVEMKEFKPFVITDLKVPYTDELKVMMKVADVEIATDVVADANGVSVEPDQNLSATVLDENFIKDLPNNEDDLRDVLQALAGPGAGASGNGQAEILVNGFRGGRLPPKDAIMKITINQNPYSAEFSQPGFGRIEITTKPGNDNWRGTVGFDYRNSATDGRNAFALTRPELDQQQYRFNFSGPIIKKKMSFFANAERRNLDGGNNTNAILPTGPFAANVLAPNSSTNFSIRTDYLINQKNTLGVSYYRSQSNAENTEFGVRFGGGFGGFGGGGGRGGGGFGGGGGGGGAVNFTLPERATNSRNASNDMQMILTTILSSKLINEARIRMGYDTRNSSPVTDAVAISVLDAFNGGGAPNGISNNRQFDYEIQNYLTYNLKKHTIKGGVQINYAKTSNFSTSNFNGTYTFPSLGEYCRITGVVCDAAFTSGAASNASRVYQFRVNTGDPRLRYNQYENSWFINDDFRFSQTFTLSLGVRQEWQTNLRDGNNIMPRVGAAWSPFKDRKTSFRFGAGMFYQRLSDSLFGNTLRVNGQTQVSYIVNNPEYLAGYKPGSAIPRSCITNAQGQVTCVSNATQVQNTTVSILANDLQAPASYNLNASVERQLPLGLTASANFVYFKSLHQFRTRNINARGFRDISACAGQQPSIDCTRPDPTRGDINQTESSADSEFKALFVQVNRRMGKYFSFFANYSMMDMRNNSEGLPANNYNLAGEWGRASFMSGHTGFIMGRITLPKGIGLSPMVNVRTGNPYNITLGTDANGDNNFNDRPAGITRNSDLPSSLYSQITGCRTGRLTNGACVISTPNPNVPGAFINTPGQSFTDFLTQNYPNGVRAFGPGAVNVNLNISKSFGFGKRDAAANAGGGGMGGGGRGGGMGGGGGRGGGMGGPGGMMGGMMGGGGAEGARYTLQLTAQVSNILNRVNFGQYSGTLTSPNFGRSISASAARQIEFGMRFSF